MGYLLTDNVSLGCRVKTDSTVTSLPRSWHTAKIIPNVYCRQPKEWKN